jgi:hypothetical protein
MKQTVIILLAICLTKGSKVNAQNYINLGAGLSDINVKEWNKSIDAFNYARPWLNTPLNNLRSGQLYQASLTAILGKAFFVSPQLAYMQIARSASTGSFATKLNIRRFSGGLNFDIYPREFGLDTVYFEVRPFVRLGGAASAFLPRIRFNDERATVNDQVYEPIIWTYQVHAGLGCRFSLSRWFDIMPVIQLNYFPNVQLENFSQALHGTNVPGLNNNARLLKTEATVFFCFRIGQNK